MIQEQTESLYLTSPYGDVFTNPLFLFATCFASNPSAVTPELPTAVRKSAEVWISPDPARQYASPYAYTPNPVNETDPDGRFVPAVLAAIATWIFMSPVEVGENAQPDRLPETAGELAEVGVIGVIFHKLGGPRGRAVGPTIDQKTGSEVGRFIVDSKGNTMIEPVGGSTVPNGLNGQSTHTLYPNGSKYQRLDMVGHPNNPTPHGHGHLQGTGPGMRGQGAPIDATGTIVPSNSAAAHWPIN